VPSGLYRLEVTLLEEGVCWFQDKGMTIEQVSEPLRIIRKIP
jgi:hypothetical protein